MNLTQNDLQSSQRLCVTLNLSDDENFKFPNDIRGKIIKSISTNEIIRDFYIKGQAFNEQHIQFIRTIVMSVRIAYPKINIIIESQKTFLDLIKSTDNRVRQILKQVSFLKQSDGSLIPIDLFREI